MPNRARFTPSRRTALSIASALAAALLAGSAEAKLVAIPPVTITSLAHRYMATFFGTQAISDGVDFPCGTNCTSAGFTTSIVHGDTVQMRFQAPAGQRFRVFRRAAFSSESFSIFAQWYASADTISTFPTPTVAFENLTGTAPVPTSQTTGVGNAGAAVAIEWQGSVTADFSFTAVTISFPVNNFPPGTTLVFGSVDGLATFSFSAGGSAALGTPDQTVMDLLSISACSNGIDDDGDGFVDYPNDPGCRFATSTTESPQCQDGFDDDGDGRIDFDGGASANHGVALAAADPQCGAAWHDREKPSTGGCGLGAELALVMPLLALVARKRGRSRLTFLSQRVGVPDS